MIRTWGLGRGGQGGRRSLRCRGVRGGGRRSGGRRSGGRTFTYARARQTPLKLTIIPTFTAEILWILVSIPLPLRAHTHTYPASLLLPMYESIIFHARTHARAHAHTDTCGLIALAEQSCIQPYSPRGKDLRIEDGFMTDVHGRNFSRIKPATGRA
ncbi:hypothetical protein F5B20DRAFT_394485 [Whalleya microplaca]|nr:hypothetical protein F5B20DRAFT_394485 [Whalleya microplaca]